MKFYNPFKWHIHRVPLGTNRYLYYIRKLTFFGWLYLDNEYNCDFVWSSRNYSNVFYNYSDAEFRLKKRTGRLIVPSPAKTIKVLNEP